MAESTINTFLLYGGAASGGATWGAALVDVLDTSDLTGENEDIDVTSLSDSARKRIDGLKNNPPWMFTCNYDETIYETIEGYEGTDSHFAVWLGGTAAVPTGTSGKWTTTGYISVKKDAAAVGEQHKMTIKIALSSGVTKS